MVSHAVWLKLPHTTYWLMGHKEATNGEPGLVVEITTPLTY